MTVSGLRSTVQAVDQSPITLRMTSYWLSEAGLKPVTSIAFSTGEFSANPIMAALMASFLALGRLRLTERAQLGHFLLSKKMQ